MATQERVAAEKQKAENRRLSAQREERMRVLKEEEKNVQLRNQNFKAPHMQRSLEKTFVSKKRQHELLLRPEFKEEDDDVKVPTLDQLKRTNSQLTPYMIQKCRDLKPWQEVRSIFFSDISSVNKNYDSSTSHSFYSPFRLSLYMSSFL